MSMQDKYEDFKEKWEDLRESQGFRWGVGARAVWVGVHENRVLKL